MCGIQVPATIPLSMPENYTGGEGFVLQNTDWDHCFEQANVDRMCEDWTSTFKDVARLCILNRVITVRPCDKMFFYTGTASVKEEKEQVP